MLGQKIMEELAALRAKTHRYLTEKRKLKFEDYKHVLEATQCE